MNNGCFHFLGFLFLRSELYFSMARSFTSFVRLITRYFFDMNIKEVAFLFLSLQLSVVYLFCSLIFYCIDCNFQRFIFFVWGSRDLPALRVLLMEHQGPYGVPGIKLRLTIYKVRALTAKLLFWSFCFRSSFDELHIQYYVHSHNYTSLSIWM